MGVLLQFDLQAQEEEEADANCIFKGSNGLRGLRSEDEANHVSCKRYT